MDLEEEKLHQEGIKDKSLDQVLQLKVLKVGKCHYIEGSRRGFKSLSKKNIAILNLSKIQNILDKNKNSLKKIIDLKILKEKNLINKKFIKLKILGTGEIKKNIEISAHFASKQALSKIEKVGGKISIIKK